MSASGSYRLLRPIERGRDHVRGGDARDGVVSIVFYGDFLCPYCRRLRPVLEKLRQVFGGRLRIAFRHFPNERAHPGAERIARAAEAAGKQGRFWDLYDWLWDQELPLADLPGAVAPHRLLSREGRGAQPHEAGDQPQSVGNAMIGLRHQSLWR